MSQKRKQKRYSDEFRQSAMAALAANDGNVWQTAKQIGIPVRTLQSWKMGEAHSELVTTCQPKKIELAAAIKETMWMLLSTTEPKARKAPLKDVGIVFGIMAEKYLLLMGQPTDIRKSVSDLNDDDLNREIQNRERTLRITPGEGNPHEKNGAA